MKSLTFYIIFGGYIPKEARELFDLQPGIKILVLGDEKRGIAILPKEMQNEYITRIFSEIDE